MRIPEATMQRLRKAYENIPDNKKPEVKSLMLAAQQHALRARGLTAADQEIRPAPHELTLAYSALFGDPALLLGPPTATEELALPPYVDPDGNIWGFGTYEQLDPGWLEAVAIWLENFNYKYPFGVKPAHVQIPDDTTIALLADWGTGQFGNGTAPPLQMTQYLQQNLPDYTIHLGDTYYSGTEAEETDNFLAGWAVGSAGTFALNSNHEMYPGGKGYFKTLLGNSAFAAQKGTSYFALANSHWIIIGLDSAYFSDYWSMYMDGYLDPVQLAFLSGYAQNARQEGKRVIVLTHHNGLAENGTGPTTLWTQVTSAFPGGTAPAYWYWGHLHAGVVYPEQNGLSPRCLGHGAIPWGNARALQGLSTVTWYETTPNPVNPTIQVMNGFVLLKLSGPTLTEQLLDQTGAPAWPT
ncbi:MAG TPA: metallophosphoesterase [Thermoanaerobaculia bacterium]